MIPRRLFDIWISDKPLSEFHKQCLSKWETVLPNYEMVTIRLKDALKIPSQYLQNAISNKNYIHAAGYLRSWALYNYGGIYFDLDVQPIKSFDPLLDNESFFGFEDKTLVGDAVIGSVAKHSIHKERLVYLETLTGTEEARTAVNTGPGLFTKLLKRRGLVMNNETQNLTDATVYNNNFFYPYYWTNIWPKNLFTSDTYSVHYWTKTWVNPEISVVIPAYNYAEYLSEAIESVLNQTQKNFEIIVVDDGSTDNTKEVALRYPITYIYQKNHGLSHARNTGIKAARGKYIVTLDADDRLEPDYIKKCYPFVPQIVCPAMYDSSRSIIQFTGDTTLKGFLEHNQIHCASLFPKEAWEKVSGYDTNNRMGCEDWDFWIRCLKAGYSVRTIPDPLFFYRTRPNTMVSTTKEKQHEIILYLKARHPDLTATKAF